MFWFKKKKKKYHMNIDTANETLQNVFSACEKEPNTIPFDKIVLRNRFNRFFYNICMLILCICFVLLLLCPLAFLPKAPSLQLQTEQGISLLSHNRVHDTLVLVLSDPNILSDECFMLTLEDEKIMPLSFDAESNTLIFPYPSEEVNIYVYSSTGAFLHLLLSPK